MRAGNVIMQAVLLAIVLTPGVQADSEAGRQFWNQQFVIEGQQRSCTSCHGQNTREPGKHQRTGKTIEPMSPAVNPERLTDPKKMQKWFTRNCKWSWGRECSVQEKSDILTWLSRQ